MLNGLTARGGTTVYGGARQSLVVTDAELANLIGEDAGVLALADGGWAVGIGAQGDGRRAR